MEATRYSEITTILNVALYRDVTEIVIDFLKDIEHREIRKFRLDHCIHPQIKLRYRCASICDQFNRNLILNVKIKYKKIIALFLYVLWVKLSFNPQFQLERNASCSTSKREASGFLFIENLIETSRIHEIEMILNNFSNYDITMALVDFLLNNRDSRYHLVHLFYALDSDIIQRFLDLLIHEFGNDISSILSLLNINFGYESYG